jgi:twitching motility two-component system response regulator PilH
MSAFRTLRPWQRRCTGSARALETRERFRDVSRQGEPAMAKVMVVDDAYSELKLIESILKSAGHQVVSFIDGDALEDKMSAERPDLLLLDIVMPKRNGYEILRALRRDERTKATPIVLVSSKNQDSDRAWGKRQGADEYLPKPFTSAELLTMVGRFAR